MGTQNDICLKQHFTSKLRIIYLVLQYKLYCITDTVSAAQTIVICVERLNLNIDVDLVKRFRCKLYSINYMRIDFYASLHDFLCV